VNTTNRQTAIMLVDSSEAFTAMLCEYLEQESDYRVAAYDSHAAALEALESDRYDLAIVDLGLNGEDGADAARGLRRRQPDLRLILIPLSGDQLPIEVADLDVQGVLSMPPFLPDLVPEIEQALSKSVAQGDLLEIGVPGVSDATLPVEEVSVPTESDDSKIDRLLHDLANELNAVAVVLSQKNQVITQISLLSTDEVNRLAQVVADSCDTSTRVAEILGKEQLRFEQSIEGGEYVFYSLAVSDNLVLSVAIQHGVPLGMIRHRAKETADEIRTVFKKE